MTQCVRTCGAVVLLLLQVGCYSRVVHDSWAPLRALADTEPPHREPGSDRPTAAGDDEAAQGYAILIESFDGPNRHRDAQAFIRRLVQQTHIPDLWIKDIGNKALVYRGRYPDPANPAAQRDVQQTRMVKLDEKRPFQNVQVVSLAGGVTSPAGPMDLRQYTGMYSLQIGYYDEHFGPGFREAAERAAKQLRDQGEDAFYYHGPNMSMVTIGLFTNNDIQQQVYHRSDGTDVIQPIYSQRVTELQHRFEYNVGNGHLPEQTPAEPPTPGAVVGAPPRPPAPASFLVRVP